MSIKLLLKVCSVAVLFLLVFAALGPAKWVPRSGLGWRIDHFVGYFVLTLTFCFAWPRPFVVGGVLMALATLLEGLQAFTPDRHADLFAALISAGGAIAAVLPADLFIQSPRPLKGRRLLALTRTRLLRASSLKEGTVSVTGNASLRQSSLRCHARS
jgi:VanZ family protein